MIPMRHQLAHHIIWTRDLSFVPRKDDFGAYWIGFEEYEGPSRKRIDAKYTPIDQQLAELMVHLRAIQIDWAIRDHPEQPVTESEYIAIGSYMYDVGTVFAATQGLNRLREQGREKDIIETIRRGGEGLIHKQNKFIARRVEDVKIYGVVTPLVDWENQDYEKEIKEALQ